MPVEGAPNLAAICRLIRPAKILAKRHRYVIGRPLTSAPSSMRSTGRSSRTILNDSLRNSARKAARRQPVQPCESCTLANLQATGQAGTRVTGNSTFSASLADAFCHYL